MWKAVHEFARLKMKTVLILSIAYYFILCMWHFIIEGVVNYDVSITGNQWSDWLCILIQIKVMEIQINVFLCVCDLVKERGNGIPFSRHLWRCLNENKVLIQ